MWDFNFSIDSSDLVDSFNLGTETSVDTESFSVDDGTDWKVVKDFGTVLPWIWVSIFSVDFIIKSVDGCDLSK